MRSRISRWIRSATSRLQRAQGLVEYGLILVLVSIAAIVIMQVLGTSVTSLYSKASTAFPGA
jgi:Flp pilus assembly pilin Flp